MSAHENLNGEQLRMFMLPGEIKSTHQVNPGDVTNWDEHMAQKKGTTPSDEAWNRKYDEARQSNLTGQIKQHGVKEPVNVYIRDRELVKGPGSDVLYPGGPKPTMGNGHHRIAAAAEHAPDRYVPVLHHAERGHALAGGYNGEQRFN